MEKKEGHELTAKDVLDRVFNSKMPNEMEKMKEDLSLLDTYREKIQSLLEEGQEFIANGKLDKGFENLIMIKDLGQKIDEIMYSFLDDMENSDETIKNITERYKEYLSEKDSEKDINTFLLNTGKEFALNGENNNATKYLERLVDFIDPEEINKINNLTIEMENKLNELIKKK